MCALPIYLGLVGEIGGRIDEYAELDVPFDAVEPAERRLHLRDQHQRAALRCALAVIEIAIGAEPAGHQRAVVEGKLARNVEQPARRDGGNLGGDGGGGFGKRELKLETDRRSGGEGTSVSERVELGGRRVIKKNKQKRKHRDNRNKQ